MSINDPFFIYIFNWQQKWDYVIQISMIKVENGRMKMLLRFSDNFVWKFFIAIK